MTLNEALTLASDCHLEQDCDDPSTETLYLYGQSVLSMEKRDKGESCGNIHEFDDVKSIIEALQILSGTVIKARELFRR